MLKPFHSCVHEAGTDEAGRGCLAGPVTAVSGTGITVDDLELVLDSETEVIGSLTNGAEVTVQDRSLKDSSSVRK